MVKLAPSDIIWQHGSTRLITQGKNKSFWRQSTSLMVPVIVVINTGIQFPAMGKHCAQTCSGMPAKFNLDPASGQDFNPKSYFYKLVPPRVAMASAQIGGGARGASSNRQSRGFLSPCLGCCSGSCQFIDCMYGDPWHCWLWSGSWIMITSSKCLSDWLISWEMGGPARLSRGPTLRP